MPKSTLSLRAGDVTVLLRLSSLDWQIREAERSQQEIVRKLNEHRVGLETLTRFLEDDRSRLAKALENEREKARLAQTIAVRHLEIGRLAAALEVDRLRADPALERLQGTLRQARADREKILERLDQPLQARYQSLSSQGTLAFIVPVRDGRCTGCALVLATELVNSVQKPDVIGACPRCERILFGQRAAEA